MRSCPTAMEEHNEEGETADDRIKNAANIGSGGSSGGFGGAGNANDGSASNLGGRFDISKLLDALIKYNGSDLHIRVNRPPCIRVRGELRNLGTTVLTPDDTTSLMKSIAGERNQLELG